MFEVAGQLRVGPVDTLAAPSDGDGVEGIPGIEQGQLTVMLSPALPEPPLVLVTEATFSTVPQVPAVVGEVMCATWVAPAAIVPKLQVITPPVMPHSEVSTLQLSPRFAGRVSVTVIKVSMKKKRA